MDKNDVWLEPSLGVIEIDDENQQIKIYLQFHVLVSQKQELVILKYTFDYTFENYQLKLQLIDQYKNIK